MLKLYKTISIILSSLLVVGGIFFYIEKKAHSKSIVALNNKIAEQQGTIKEKESLYSSLSVRTESLEKQLEAESQKMRDLKKIIIQRGEEIESITKISLNWKDLYLKAKNAQDSIIPNTGTTISQSCEECFLNHRVRVDFDEAINNWRVTGYTLNNPAEAELTLKRIKPLVINLVLTKTKNGYRTYLSDENSELSSAKINLMLDDKSFAKKWYEKISITGDMSLSAEGLSIGANLLYGFFSHISIGPRLSLLYDGEEMHKFYGVGVEYFPFGEE